MPFYLYFFTHSQVFHKCSLKSPLLNFPQIPYLILSGFLLSSRMETALYRFTRSLNNSQKLKHPFLPSVSGHRRQKWFFTLEDNWSHCGLASRLGACCGCWSMGGGRDAGWRMWVRCRRLPRAPGDCLWNRLTWAFMITLVTGICYFLWWLKIESLQFGDEA